MLSISGMGSAEESGIVSRMIRGVSNPRVGSKILTLSTLIGVHSSLQHLRGSWKVKSQKLAER